MILEPVADPRESKKEDLVCDLVVAGGGLAGTCCAITAARAGVKVVLIQDRPVLGGNASSEVRLWALGASSHMGNNNRWAREGGVMDEIFVENTFRNPEGNPHLFDAVLLDKVISEPNIKLLLNTAIYKVSKSDPETIKSVHAFCSQNETFYEVAAPLFCDASGDGVVGFQAGAAFRIGSEAREEFGEKFAPDREYGELLGHTIFFYSKNTGKPVTFVPPSFALDDITKIPRFGQISAADSGCQFWWLEYGGRLNTIHQSEQIKWELWKVVYGVWNYIKNSGKFPEAENLTLEWVGTIPGKRESRRFEGDYMLKQQDVIEQRRHEDAVAFGGWAIDLHPADGVYSEKPGCTQWHSKGVYQIPFRTLYSRNIKNLFLGGRIISVSHVAFGSTRVMATTGHTGQAVGMAAAICREQGLVPRELLALERMKELQNRLLATGHYIPHLRLEDVTNLAATAHPAASSSFELRELPRSGQSILLEASRAMVVPVAPGPMPRVTLYFDVETDASIEIQLRVSEREGNFSPDRVLATKQIALSKGQNQACTVDFEVTIDSPRYVFICLMASPSVSACLSDQRVTGVLSIMHGANRKVAKNAVQSPIGDIGVETFEFWIPERRPAGKNLAIAFEPPIALFGPANVLQGQGRPTTQPNAWVASLEDENPKLALRWDAPQSIGRIELFFDTDFDHAMESVQWGHPERAMPFCVQHYRILDGDGNLLAEVHDNHQTRNTIRLEPAILTDHLVVECLGCHGRVPTAIFQLRCYGS